MESGFSGKTALVTGGTSGIGESICRLFARQGAGVFVHYNKNKEKADKLAEEIKGFSVQADVSNEKDVKKMREEVLRKAGGLDFLVNNAGDIDWIESYKQVTELMWDRVVDANLKGTFLVTKEFAGDLSKASGAVVNLGSTAHFESKFPALHYNASKAGVASLTKSFSRQLAPKVRVNSVAPGFIKTNFEEKYSKEKIKQILDGIPLARFGEPDDVGKVVLELCSSKFGYVTGQTIIVDGGRITP
ncbi:SDR family oxidoreductase [Candidatus Micrarchaeota archaeon]|nr:SDR family oxidoreductase [Candidatus Micrarchaeota archaeon]